MLTAKTVARGARYASTPRPNVAIVKLAYQTPDNPVCVTTYDDEGYLRDCLDSFLQTFRDFERLLVDDCSK